MKLACGVGFYNFYLKIAVIALITGETIDDANVIQRIFPRVCATAEKLWSTMNVTNVDDAMKRLEEHYCRLRHRNINAQVPSGPGFCI